MSFLEKVAEAPNQREALLLIAGALDMIYEAIHDQPVAERSADGWGDSGGWNSETGRGVDRFGEEAKVVAMHREGNDYVIPPPSDDLRLARAQFSENYLINDVTVADAYVKGGPEWLTAYDSDFVMTLPADAKQGMAIDYESRGLTQEALEFSVAFLKGEAISMATAAPMADTLPGAPR